MGVDGDATTMTARAMTCMCDDVSCVWVACARAGAMVCVCVRVSYVRPMG